MFKLFVLAALVAVAAAGVVAPVGTYSTTVKSGYPYAAAPLAYSAYSAGYPYSGAYGHAAAAYSPYAYGAYSAAPYSAYPYAGAYGAYPYAY